MSKIAFLCPGYGSEAVGMGVGFMARYSWGADLFEEVKAIVGLDVFDICMNESQEELSQTQNAQPCLATTAIVTARALRERGIEPDCVAGYAEGEYAAHVIAETADLQTCMELVARRGALTAMAAHMNPGQTALLLDCSQEQAEELCQKHADATGKALGIAAFNCPGQIAISGATEALDAALEDWRSAGGKAAKTSENVAFNSNLMKSVVMGMTMPLKHILFGPGEIPVYSSATGRVFDYMTPAEQLGATVSEPVKWQQTVERMLDDGVDTFIECGPGKLLIDMVRRTAEARSVEVKLLSAATPEDVMFIKL